MHTPAVNVYVGICNTEIQPCGVCGGAGGAGGAGRDSIEIVSQALGLSSLPITIIQTGLVTCINPHCNPSNHMARGVRMCIPVVSLLFLDYRLPPQVSHHLVLIIL